MSVCSQEAGERTHVKGLRVCVDLSGSFVHGGQRGKIKRQTTDVCLGHLPLSCILRELQPVHRGFNNITGIGYKIYLSKLYPVIIITTRLRVLKSHGPFRTQCR